MSTDKSIAHCKFPRIIIWILRILLPILIVIGGIKGARKLIETAPKHTRASRGERVVTVETMALLRSNHEVIIQTTGTVIPAREIDLKPRVAGQVATVSNHLEPGSILKSGDTALTLDTTDYLLTLRDLESMVTQAEYSYKLELGQQDIARYQWESLAGKASLSKLDEELTLRKPHLAKAQADLDAAKAKLERGKLDLERCTVKIPFNAIVTERHVTTGSQVTTQTILARLVATDEYWIEASIPTDQLRWINTKDTSAAPSEVAIRPTGLNAANGQWSGHIERLLPELEPNGRMARLLISVKNPLNKNNPLLLGSFVTISLKGTPLKSVFVLPSLAVREGNTVWLIDENGRMQFRQITPLIESAACVVVDTGLSEGEQLIISDVAAPAPGLLLTPTSRETPQFQEGGRQDSRQGSGQGARYE